MKLGKSSYYFQIGLLVTVLVFLGALTWPRAEAQSESTAVEGYAWSDNIGWIHFNHNKANPVTVSPTGDLSGYAWSDNIGWISLNRGDTSTPPLDDSGNGGGAIAKVSPPDANGVSRVIGWARAVSGKDFDDGWDGWIRFDHDKANPVTVNASTGRADGYAWGSDVIGWIDMSPGNDGPPEPCEATNSCPCRPYAPYFDVCVDNPGNPLAVTCSMPGTATVNTSVTWQASASGGQTPYTYAWEWFNSDDTSVAEGVVVELSDVGVGGRSVKFTVEGTYKGKVTVTDSDGDIAPSAFCTVEGTNDDTIEIGNGETTDLFTVDPDCDPVDPYDDYCILEINRDRQPDEIYSNVIKLINNFAGSSLTWSATPSDIDPDDGNNTGHIQIMFCTSSTDETSCQISLNSNAANIFVRAKVSGLPGSINQEIDIKAISVEDELIRTILLEYKDSNSGQKSL